MKKLKARPDGGDPHLMVAGLIPATDEERLELKQKLLNLTEQESRNLLEKLKMNKRRAGLADMDDESHWKIFGDIPATDEERIQLMQKFYHLPESEAERLLEDFKNTPKHVENILNGYWR